MVIENDNISQIAQQQQEVGQTERAAPVISQSMVVSNTYSNSRLALTPGLPHSQLLIACSMIKVTKTEAKVDKLCTVWILPLIVPQCVECRVIVSLQSPPSSPFPQTSDLLNQARNKVIQCEDRSHQVEHSSPDVHTSSSVSFPDPQ